MRNDQFPTIDLARTYHRNHQRIYVRAHRERVNAIARKSRRTVLERKFNVSYPTWWLCDICSKPISAFKYHGEYQCAINLDHNHETGLFRSWLCFKCNSQLGWLQKFSPRIQMVLE